MSTKIALTKQQLEEASEKRKDIAKARRGAQKKKDIEELGGLIKELRHKLSAATSCPRLLTELDIQTFTTALKKIRKSYVYSGDTYPDLKNRDRFIPSTDGYPTSLAEMFIWKQTDWPKYLRFRDWYISAGRKPKGGAVHYAFADFLSSKKPRPIFDQHSARAVLAILRTQPDFDTGIYTNYLLYREKWDSNHGDDYASIFCYEKYQQDIRRLTESDNYDLLNKLLMPLGRAIKKLMPWPLEF